MGRFGAYQVHLPTAIINYVEKGNEKLSQHKVRAVLRWETGQSSWG